MLELILFLLLSILVVFVSALLFVNSIEFLGSRYNIGGSFVGTILSPVVTSLPELIVLLIAIFGLGGISGSSIAVGTIFGQPFMASSLSYGLIGLAALIGYSVKSREHNFLEVSKTLVIPFIFVTILFPLTLIPSLIGIDILRYLFGIFFLVAYIGYVTLMYRRKTSEPIENASEPYICVICPPRTAGGFIQLAISVAVLYFGADLLVRLVNQIAIASGFSLMGLAIILVPAATAVPETSSALIWAFRGKDTLSIGSLVGEKVLYTTLFPGLGLMLTTWVLDIHVYLAVLGTTIVSLMMLLLISRRRIHWYALTLGLIFFVAYASLTFGLRV